MKTYLPKIFFTQNISAANIEKFESKLHTLNDVCLNFYFRPDINGKDAQSQFSAFYTKLKDIYNDCFVEAVDSNRKRNFVNTPWITLTVAKSCKMNKCWSHIAPCSRLYLVKLKVVAQLKSQQ